MPTKLSRLQDYFDFKDRKIPEDTIWGIFYEILIGINDIHEANVAHLDLKPSNILIDNNGSIKIADFGISIQTPAVSLYSFRICIWD